MQTQRGRGTDSTLVAIVKNIYQAKGDNLAVLLHYSSNMVLTFVAGMKGFYRGYVPCVLRAFPANAVVFLGFELTSKALRAKE
jgi:hypothetical protein